MCHQYVHAAVHANNPDQIHKLERKVACFRLLLLLINFQVAVTFDENELRAPNAHSWSTAGSASLLDRLEFGSQWNRSAGC